MTMFFGTNSNDHSLHCLQRSFRWNRFAATAPPSVDLLLLVQAGWMRRGVRCASYFLAALAMLASMFCKHLLTVQNFQPKSSLAPGALRPSAGKSGV